MPISPERLEVRRRRLVDAAHALIRETGDAGFSMAQLAARAGVSPATPYNLLGSKSELLRLIVRDEFEGFAAKLADLAVEGALDRLLAAVDLVAVHYGEDPGFYRGIYRAALGTDHAEFRGLMLVEGRVLWRAMVEAAVRAEGLDAAVRAGPLTDVLLRVITITTEGWFAVGWCADRFALELAHAARLVLASVAAPGARGGLARQLAEMQVALDELGEAKPDIAAKHMDTKAAS